MSLIAHFDTDRGPIRIALYPDKAPLTVANFVNLAQRGFYNGLNFHRVINDFMIQKFERLLAFVNDCDFEPQPGEN